MHPSYTHPHTVRKEKKEEKNRTGSVKTKGCTKRAPIVKIPHSRPAI
jgi:hypothetical protein